MLKMLGASLGNNIPLIITLIVIGVLVLIGIVTLVAFMPKIKAKHQQKMQRIAEEKAKAAEEDAKNKAYDDNVFANRKQEVNKIPEFKEAKESESVVGILQHQEGEKIDVLNNHKGATIGSEKDRDDVISVLQGKQYDGKVDTSDKKIDVGDKKSADHIMSVMNAPNADGNTAGTQTTDAKKTDKEEK